VLMCRACVSLFSRAPVTSLASDLFVLSLTDLIDFSVFPISIS
jgi:hypothetical protein